MSVLSEMQGRIAGLQRRAMMIAIVTLALSALGWFLDSEQFYRSYVVAFFFVISIPLGSLVVVMLHHLTGGAWGFAVRRLLEASLRTLPLLVLFALPLLAGLLFGDLYPWADAEVRAHDPVLKHKEPYLNETFFLIRTAFYFAAWIGLGFVLMRLQKRYDETRDRQLLKRLKNVAGPGIGLYGVTMTFAAFDWGMSLEPHWFSTIYGAMFIVGQVLATWCFAIVMAAWLTQRKEYAELIRVDHFHDLGNLTFAFTMLWAYLSFSQYLIIWSGNMAEETPWYLRRSNEGWQVVVLLLVFFHFFVPFFALLARRTKRSVPVLVKLAIAVLVLRVVDLFWLIAPAFHEGVTLSWLDIVLPIALFSTWFMFYASRLKGRPLVMLQVAREPDETELSGQEAHA